MNDPDKQPFALSVADVIKSALSNLVSVATSIFILTLIFFLLTSVRSELKKDYITVESFDVPENLSDDGYSGKVIAINLVDQINFIRDNTTKKVVSFRQSSKNIPIASPNIKNVDFEVPSTGISLRNSIKILREYLDKDVESITGDVVEIGNDIEITVRYKGKVFKSKSKRNSIPESLKSCAYQLLEHFEPVTIGYYLLSVESYSKCESFANRKILISKNEIEKADLYYALAVTKTIKYRYDSASSFCEKAIKLNPEHAGALLLAGETSILLNRLSEAQSLLNEVIKLDPTYDFGYIGMGDLKVKQRRFEEAKTMYNKAISINPNTAAPYIRLGYVLEEQKKQIEAESYYNTAILIDPQSMAAYTSLGYLKIEQGNLKQAEAIFNKAIKINSRKSDGYELMSYLRAIENKPKSALYYANKAIKVNNRSAYGYYLLGHLKLANKAYIPAEKYFLKSLEIDNTNTLYIAILGYIYEFGHNDYVRAKELYTLALSLDSEESTAKKGLERIRDRYTE